MFNETTVTVRGALVGEPHFKVLPTGTELYKFRLISTQQTYDRETRTYRNGKSLFASVVCWRSLALTARDQLDSGAAVIVVGTLSTREYEVNGTSRTEVEITADSIGLDIRHVAATIATTDGASDAESAAVA